MTARGDQCSGVLLQECQPVAEVGGVVHPCGLLESELSAPKRSAELGDELLGAVGPITEATREIPAQPRRVAVLVR